MPLHMMESSAGRIAKAVQLEDLSSVVHRDTLPRSRLFSWEKSQENVLYNGLAVTDHMRRGCREALMATFLNYKSDCSAPDVVDSNNKTDGIAADKVMNSTDMMCLHLQVSLYNALPFRKAGYLCFFLHLSPLSLSLALSLYLEYLEHMRNCIREQN
jgi:hypothetical protein